MSQLEHPLILRGVEPAYISHVNVVWWRKAPKQRGQKEDLLPEETHILEDQTVGTANMTHQQSASWSWTDDVAAEARFSSL